VDLRYAKHPKFAKHLDAANFLLEEIYPEEKQQIVTCRSGMPMTVGLFYFYTRSLLPLY
jgi:hypothetical protein